MGNPPKTIKYLTVPVVARYRLHISDRHVRRMCESGVFVGAIKPGKSHWKIPESAVEAHLSRKLTNDE